MPYAIYLRKSRSDDVGESIADTLSKHKNTLLNFAKTNNLPIAKIYEEVVSGDKLVTRPEMLKLLDDVGNNMYDGVLCMDIDRLGRGSMSDQGIIIETFKNSDTKIVTPRKVYDLSNDFDEEYTEFETFMARRELKMISRRLHRGTKAAIDDGAYCANPPYGYVRAYINKRSSLAINEDEAAFVRMMFDMYVNGAGCQIIADTVNSMGAKPHRAQKFGRTSVRGILKNPIYTGKTVNNKNKFYYDGNRRTSKPIPKSEWVYRDGLHPAIISEDVFNKVQEIFAKQFHPPYFTGQLINPLAGIIKCSVCGSTIQRRPYNDRNVPDYMLCQTRGCCAASKFELVEQEFLRQVRDKLAELEMDLKNNDSKSTQHLRQAVSALEKEQQNILNQKNRLYDLLEQQVYTIDVFTSRMTAIDARLSECENNLQQSKATLEKYSTESRQAAIDKIKSVLDSYHTSDPNTQNQMLKEIVTSATYFKAKGWPVDRFILQVELIEFIR